MVDQALHTWSTNVSGVLTQAQASAQAARDEVERVVRQRTNDVAAIEAVISSTEPEKRRELQAKLVHAKDARDQAKRMQVQIQDIACGVVQLHRAHTPSTTTQVASVRARLSAMSRALEGYRSGGGLFGSGGLARSVTVGAAASDSAGMFDVDVSAADLDDNPILDEDGAQGTFGKGGLSRADYRWAVQTWADVVGPGVAKGKMREDFSARDAESNARPLRRTADVYDLFLGSDRIRADRQADGSLNIINGRHRLLIARELGIKSLPGDVH